MALSIESWQKSGHEGKGQDKVNSCLIPSYFTHNLGWCGVEIYHTKRGALEPGTEIHGTEVKGPHDRAPPPDGSHRLSILQGNYRLESPEYTTTCQIPRSSTCWYASPLSSTPIQLAPSFAPVENSNSSFKNLNSVSLCLSLSWPVIQSNNVTYLILCDHYTSPTSILFEDSQDYNLSDYTSISFTRLWAAEGLEWVTFLSPSA